MFIQQKGLILLVEDKGRLCAPNNLRETETHQSLPETHPLENCTAYVSFIVNEASSRKLTFQIDLEPLQVLKF